MTAETFDEYIARTFRIYAREKGIDLKSLAYQSVESGWDVDACNVNFRRLLRGYANDFRKVIGQYMGDDVEASILNSIELEDLIDMDVYFDDDGIAYSPKSGKSSGKRAPKSRSVKRRFFPKGTTTDRMAEMIAQELISCGLDKGYPGFEPGPNWDVYDDCYWYMDTGDRKDFTEWERKVRSKCPKAADMIEEAIRIFEDDGIFDSLDAMYAGTKTMSSPASKRGRPAGRSGTKPAGKSGGKTHSKTTKTAPRSKSVKPKKNVKPAKGARK